MTTLRQIAANRRNAAHSTGPITEEGKKKSCANALKHGLAGEGLILPDEEMMAVEDRIQQWDSSFHPFDQADVWLVRVVAVESVRVDRCKLHEADLRERLARRADLFWDDDRRLAAEVLAAAMARKPEIASRQLRQTTQGVDLLIERWQSLGDTLARNGAWNEAQRSLALDLLGVPRDLRDGPTMLDGPKASSVVDWLREIVHGQITGLIALKPVLDELDGQEQAAAMLGLESTPDTELKRLRRYEAACMRRFQWAYNKLKARKRPERPGKTEEDRQPSPPVAIVEPTTPVDPEAERNRLHEAAVEVMMDPDNHDPWAFYEYCRLSELPGSQLPMLPLLAQPPVPTPPEPVRPRPPFPRNRRARRAARLKARRP